MESFAAFTIKKPESCVECDLLINRNIFSGSCIINKDFRMPLDKTKRAGNCPLVFIDEERNVFPVTTVKEAFDDLLTIADDLESISNDPNTPEDVILKSTWKRQGILEAIKAFGNKMRVLDVQEWFDEKW